MTKISETIIMAFILGAGCSERFKGKIKQLLPFRNKPIIQTVIDEACRSMVDEVFIVLGCRWRKVAMNIDKGRARIILNRHYGEGLSSSLRVAVKKAEQMRADACLILLADQPFVTADYLNRMVEVYRATPAAGVISSYKDAVGTPALIAKELFSKVKELKGDAGAKKVLAEVKDVIKMNAPELMLMDVDTQQDYERLQHIEN